MPSNHNFSKTFLLDEMICENWSQCFCILAPRLCFRMAEKVDYKTVLSIPHPSTLALLCANVTLCKREIHVRLLQMPLCAIQTYDCFEVSNCRFDCMRQKRQSVYVKMCQPDRLLHACVTLQIWLLEAEMPKCICHHGTLLVVTHYHAS